MTFESALFWRYHLTPADVEITETPGYWQMKTECGPDCQHPMHTYLGCKGRTKHTIAYQDAWRDPKTGRWVSPYRTWNAHRQAALEEKMTA